jgi:hypothetical protein
MGDFRERLLWSRAPVVGYGSNDAAGVSSTTGADGAPLWSVDDDVMPMSFFNARTGEFEDSVQNRVSSRIMVNFGNPFKDKRGDAIVPEDFLSQSPSFKRGKDEGSFDDGPHTPPGSPPHDAFTSAEGEDEAVFVVETVRRKSPHHSGGAEMFIEDKHQDGKRPREEEEVGSKASGGNAEAVQEAPRKKAKVMPEAHHHTTPRPPPPPPKPPQKKSQPPPPPRPPPRPPAEKSPATKPPAPAPVKAKPVESAPAAATSSAPLDLQSPDKKPQVDLPAGWMCVWSKSQQRWYFFDTRTNKSVWQWPPPGGLHR